MSSNEDNDRVKWLARLPEENPDPVLRVAPGSILLYANEAARRLLSDLVLVEGHPVPEQLAEAARESLARGTRHKVELVSDGRCFSLNLVPVGSEVNVYGRDITDRKLAEEALRERENDLRAANERLIEADKHKNEFLAMLSHELRNPLAPIRNSLHVLDHSAPDGERAHRARAVIERQVEHMARLVDDLLDVTRISRGKIQLQREHVDLNELARGTVEDHRSVFAERGVGLEFTGANRPITVHGDRTRLGQVVGNLLVNAAKFTPRGGRATVSVELDAGGDHAVVRVVDTGIGITPEILPLLFEPFIQGPTTLDRSAGGLGLGLALVKGLVDMHGGSVSADSAGAGQGATFTLRVPVDGAPAQSRPLEPGPASSPGSRRVLVIEDNLDAAESLRDALELGDHVVLIASSGAEGLEKARAFAPDVVICDIGLPGMDGYDVARSLRADPSLGRTALVALTGYAAAEDVSRAAQAGFDLHLAKPPSIDDLERALVDAATALEASRG